MQKKLNPLRQAFFEKDMNETGFINFEKFKSALRCHLVNISPSLATDQDLHDLFNRFTKGAKTINYTNFIIDINSYEFTPENFYVITSYLYHYNHSKRKIKLKNNKKG
jgi:Ca2+-binding EF-hand superfamily protein